MAAAPSRFRAPLRHIFDLHDHQAFQHSAVHEDLLKFIAALNTAVTDKSNKADVPVSQTVTALVSLLHTLGGWVDAIPPIKQAMRYGNKAYREWHAQLTREAPALCAALLTPAVAGAEVELMPYLCDAFGNPTRIDYGTGHETTFIVFLYCLCKLGLCAPADLPALGLRVFPAYLDVARKLQRTYWLEPAGSHGVWSLDDYQFLVFLFGSAQLTNHPRIKPRSIHSEDILEGFSGDFMYLAAIRFINRVKSGAPFAEHSPILNDISELPGWGKVNEGLAKMYRGEVLGKLPVVQHFLFGSLLPADWTPSRPPVPSESSAHALHAGPAAEAAALSAGAVPMDDPEQAVAPWVTGPIPAATTPAPLRVSPHGAAADPTLTGVAPWASAASAAGGARSPTSGLTAAAAVALTRSLSAGSGSPGAERPSPRATSGGGSSSSSGGSSSPESGQGPSTVTSFLEAFGPLPHITPRQAEAAAAAEAEAVAAAAEAAPVAATAAGDGAAASTS